jgi:hypothetical protein
MDSPPVDCGYANKFAVTTARLMRGGATSTEVFNRYGGVDSLSRGSIGVINYVFSFRTNVDVSVERVAGLTQAKCRAGSLGDVSCESLPSSFTDSLGSCDADAAAEEQQQAPIDTPPPAGAIASRARQPATRGSDSEPVQQCKKRYRDEIDAIDAQMRRGYTSEQGEVYREQLRDLTRQLRRCEA